MLLECFITVNYIKKEEVNRVFFCGLLVNCFLMDVSSKFTYLLLVLCLAAEGCYVYYTTFSLQGSTKQTFYKSLLISSLNQMVTWGCVNPGGTVTAF